MPPSGWPARLLCGSTESTEPIARIRHGLDDLLLGISDPLSAGVRIFAQDELSMGLEPRWPGLFDKPDRWLCATRNGPSERRLLGLGKFFSHFPGRPR